jgi:fructose-1,6-bisphosphatase-3
VIGESVLLQTLAKRYPTVDAAVAELSNLELILALPKPTVHVVSDVHGEYAKLRQVVANASGSLRPLVESLSPDPDLLGILYRPRETWLRLSAATPERDLVLRYVPLLADLIRLLGRRYTLKWVDRIIPDPYDPLFRELLRGPGLPERVVAPFLEHGRALDLVRMMAHVVRNLAVGELVVAGDLGDRGPRIDKVFEVLMAQPHVAVTFGNHDGDWLAACLGAPAAIATVVRLSLRYQRLAQLEEGYGISLAPLRALAAVYDGDPCEAFAVQGEGTPELARMHKAISILQFKLEGALFRRRSEWKLEHRALLHRIDPREGTVEIDGKRYPLRDTKLPTIDWSDPYALSPAEQQCFDALRKSFLDSHILWQHMTWLAAHGRMWLRRDLCAIFHGCVPVDDKGEFLAMTIDGVPRAGRALLDAFDTVVHRAVRARDPADAELVFYLWTGPLSPCFGKDRMATFETYFVADKATQVETKNPYFALIHDKAFCAKVLREFGVDGERGFIINGHVPVKLDAGETPIKKSGRAITIDGAFAAAYGDKGFSLVLDAKRMYLAQHHHYAGDGDDIVPTVSDVETYDPPRTVSDTELGAELRAEKAALEELLTAYENNTIREGR